MNPLGVRASTLVTTNVKIPMCMSNYLFPRGGVFVVLQPCGLLGNSRSSEVETGDASTKKQGDSVANSVCRARVP